MATVNVGDSSLQVDS